MSLTNIEVMKQTIGLSSYEDEWIHNSMVSSSPFGDFIVISSSSCAVFYMKKYVADMKHKANREPSESSSMNKKSTPIFQILRTYCPISEDAGSITAVRYLPVKVMSSNGRSQDMWHCVAIGYSSGFFEVIAAESGDVLLSKQLSKPGSDTTGNKVISIQCLATVSISKCGLNRSSNSYLGETLAVPKLQELIVVMDSTLAIIESSALFSALVKGKNEIAAARTSDNDQPQKINHVPFKRCKVRKQSKIVDAIAYAVANVPFDQYHRISMNRDLLNEEHLRTLSYVITYVTVGSGPFIQHNSPHQLSPQNINELAANVVSTVKSGLFRAATGFIGSWTGGNADNDEAAVQPDPEQTLHIRHAFKDNSKTAMSIKMSPDGRYAAILDEHNRVLLLDNSVNGNGAASGTVVHIWKGYHHAQIGWITTSWEDRKGDKSDRIPQDVEIGVLLVLYLPRRGLLEVWSPEQKFRIVEFPVGKHGKLISCTNALLDENGPTSPLSVRTVAGCAFLETSGMIKQIYVPVHSLTSKSSSHDTIIRKQLIALATEEPLKGNEQSAKLAESQIDEDKTTKIIDLILSAKSTMGKIDMLVELFHVWKVENSTNQKRVIDAVTSQLSESEVAHQRCSLLHDLLEFYDFLKLKWGVDQSSNIEDLCVDSFTSLSTDDIKTMLDCTTQEAENFIHLFKNCSSFLTDTVYLKDRESLSFAGFISCFDLKDSWSGVTEDGNTTKACKIRLKPKLSSVDMNMLCRYIAKASFVDTEQTLSIMRSKGIGDGYTLIQNLLHNAIKNCNLDNEKNTIQWVKNMLRSNNFKPICNLAFNLHETNGDGSSFQTLIQVGRQILIRNNTISLAMYGVTLAWKKFLLKMFGEPHFR